MNTHRPTRAESPEQTIRRLGDQTQHDIAETIQRLYGTPQRQASDALALVAIALFCGTVAIIAQLAMH